MQIAHDFRNDSKPGAVRVGFMFIAETVGVLYVNANRKAADIMDDAAAAYRLAVSRAKRLAGCPVGVTLVRITQSTR